MSNNLEQLTSIIVLNYNAGDLLIDCVESIYKTLLQKFEVIVVDNISTDNSHKKCKEKFPQIHLIENEQNLGYCEGNNVGIRKAKGEFVVILNPDTKVEPNWLNELVIAHKKNGDGLYQPKILAFKNNIFESAGNMLQIFGFGYPKGRGEKDIGQYNISEDIIYASGACLFTSMKVLKKIGLFDPFLFLYHDDLELGWRAAQQNIKSYYVPKATIHHFASYNLKWSEQKFFWLERNRHYCLLTHYSRGTFYKMLPALIIVEIMVLFFFLVKRFGKAKLRAYWDIIKNLKDISKKYSELESKKIISDKELIKKFPDNVIIPNVISISFTGGIFNSIMSNLSKIVKKII